MIRYLLMAIVCSVHAPHPCKSRVLASYPTSQGCLSGQDWLRSYPEPRQTKVWCKRTTITK